MAERDIKSKSGSVKRDITPKKKKKPTVKRDISHNREDNTDRLGKRMDIREQTVSRRRSAREEKRINPDSPEVRRGARRKQGYRIKKKKKGVSRAFMVYTALFLVVFILISSLSAVLFYANLVKADAADYSNIKLKMGLQHEVEEITAVSVDVDKYYRDGIMYLNMTKMAETFDFVVTGDHNELRFITNEESGDEVRFDLGTHFAKINGSSVRLDGMIVKENGAVFVPAEFVSEYMNGIEYSFDEEKQLITVLRSTARNEAGRFVQSDIGFKLKSDSESTSLPEGELTEAEKAKCYFKNISADQFNSLNQTAG